MQKLADTLDADVKRWSSGKEKNLRALLSTLQYVTVSPKLLHISQLFNESEDQCFNDSCNPVVFNFDDSQILGAESGWKPIPLTDLVSSASVRKAYRKATLYVHPDKLQQRGASTQQKYICEKVFDLLKVRLK